MKVRKTLLPNPMSLQKFGSIYYNILDHLLWKGRDKVYALPYTYSAEDRSLILPLILILILILTLMSKYLQILCIEEIGPVVKKFIFFVGKDVSPKPTCVWILVLPHIDWEALNKLLTLWASVSSSVKMEMVIFTTSVLLWRFNETEQYLAILSKGRLGQLWTRDCFTGTKSSQFPAQGRTHTSESCQCSEGTLSHRERNRIMRSSSEGCIYFFWVGCCGAGEGGIREGSEVLSG